MKKWTVNHFSLSNPKGRSQEDVPKLLRRLARTITELGDVEIQDIVMSRDFINEHGNYWRATVYYYDGP